MEDGEKELDVSRTLSKKSKETSDKTGHSCYNNDAAGMNIGNSVETWARRWKRNEVGSFSGEGLNSTLNWKL